MSKETKWTKGPWVAECEIGSDNNWNPSQRVTIHSGDVLIAQYDTEFVEYPEDAENAANAHLIAAAPMLYEALESIDMMACYASEEDTGSREEMLLKIGEAARSALAAARGE